MFYLSFQIKSYKTIGNNQFLIKLQTIQNPTYIKFNSGFLDRSKNLELRKELEKEQWVRRCI